MKKIIIISMVFGLNLYGDWRVDTINIFSHRLSGLLIANGRNDGKNRLYCLLWNGVIEEVWFENGEWNFSRVCSLPSKIPAITFAKGRHDDTLRLYIIAKDSTLRELTHRNGRWQEEIITDTIHSPLSIGAGYGRNDDTVRLYVGYTGKYAVDEIIELTFRNRWEVSSQITHGGIRIEGIKDGRNDGILRLYACYLTMDEFTWKGQKWELSSEISPLMGWRIGRGRGDGIMRVYGCEWDIVNWYHYTLEYTFDNGKWNKEFIEDEEALDCAGIGDIHGDKKDRVYFELAGRALYEYEWSAEGWKKDTIIPYKWPYSFTSSNNTQVPQLAMGNIRHEEPMPRLAIGNIGRSDTAKIYYVFWEDSALLEISYKKIGIEEESNKELSTLVSCIYFSRDVIISIPLSAKNIRCHIYNSAGKLIKELNNRNKILYWDGKDKNNQDMPAGIYFCDISVEEAKYKVKLIKLK